MAHTPQNKRRIETIDLTGPDDEVRNWRPQKQVKSELPTPPSSSQHYRNDVYRRSTQSSPSQRGAWDSTQAEVNRELVDADEADDLDHQDYQLYGVIETKVVGVRFYNGFANQGEYVVIRREPSNQYDSNAIRIDNVMGNQIGHVPRGPAAKIAPFIDDRSLLVEGLLTGRRGEFDIPMNLKLYGPKQPRRRDQIKQKMKDAKLPTKELNAAEKEEKRMEKERQQQRAQQQKRELAAAAKNASGVRKGGSGLQFDANGSSDFANITVPGYDENSGELSLDDIIGNSTHFNPRELGEVVDKYGAGEDALKDIPMAKQPAVLATKLLPYQRQGLAWMLDRENPVLPTDASQGVTQLWKKEGQAYRNIATNYTTKSPVLARGGILADDMGLGKTIQMISLIVLDKAQKKQPTLIISPLSVMSNWSGQIETHVLKEHKLKILIYHGSNKTGQKPADFGKYDVVITTYNTMALEYMPAGVKRKPEKIPRSSGLFSVEWRRVVLDEGHQIRNPKSKMAQAAYALPADTRWVLTGTPIVNSLKDLQSHIRFLHFTGGLEQPDIFNGTLTRPLSQGSEEAATLLQALVATMCLRRMKDMKFIDLRLPELSSHKYAVTFLPHERKAYEAFQSEAKGLLLQFQQQRKNAKGQNTYSHLLEVLLRLRQTCNHWRLCEERATNLMALLEQNKVVELNPENVKALRDLLQLAIDSQEECPVCLDTLHEPVITPCAHVFGRSCVERVIEGQHKCPMCRSPLKDTEILVQPATEIPESASSGIDIDTSSSKVEALLSILKASRKKGGGTKTVVFSQWTSFLDIIQHQLVANGFNFTRLDGTMKVGQRDEAIAALTNDSECTIMLASLSVCSVGLNLVAANHVILADSWWAPAIEDQAVDRVHRLGQTRPTTVFRLVMEDSIEERVLEIQQRKRELMMTAFQEKSSKRGNERAARLGDIEKLLG